MMSSVSKSPSRGGGAGGTSLPSPLARPSRTGAAPQGIQVGPLACSTGLKTLAPA